jgi:hypothetical protein
MIKTKIKKIKEFELRRDIKLNRSNTLSKFLSVFSNLFFVIDSPHRVLLSRSQV